MKLGLPLRLLWNKWSISSERTLERIRLQHLIVGVIAANILVAVVYRHWGKDEATLVVYWLTAIIVLVYTFETHGMRREMIRQNDISIQPLLITSIVPRKIVGEVIRGEDLNVLNIGRGPALFVHIDPIEIVPGDEHNIDFEVVDCVEAAKSVLATAKYAGRSDFVARLKPNADNLTHRVTVHYEDINGRKRYSVMQMGKGGIRLLKHGQAKPT